MQRINPFRPLYDKVNHFDPKIKKQIANFPLFIDVELTNYCNLQCLMCSTGTGATTRKQGYMDKSTYKKIIDEAREYGAAVRFVRWGEPLLHPQVIDYINEAKKKKLMCHINTNGILMDRNISQAFIDMGLDSIKFSFQGADERSYKEMRQHGDYEKLIQNIKTMYNLREERMLPYMHIGSTTTYESDELIEQFKTDMSKICDLVTVGSTLMINIADIEKTSLTHEQRDCFITLKEKQLKNIKRYLHCGEVYGRLSVDWDGRVTACSSDYDAELIIGDVNQNSLKEIFNNEKMNQYRDILRNGDYNAISRCSRCFDYNNFQS